MLLRAEALDTSLQNAFMLMLYNQHGNLVLTITIVPFSCTSAISIWSWRNSSELAQHVQALGSISPQLGVWWGYHQVHKENSAREPVPQMCGQRDSSSPKKCSRHLKKKMLKENFPPKTNSTYTSRFLIIPQKEPLEK